MYKILIITYTNSSVGMVAVHSIVETFDQKESAKIAAEVINNKPKSMSEPWVTRATLLF